MSWLTCSAYARCPSGVDAFVFEGTNLDPSIFATPRPVSKRSEIERAMQKANQLAANRSASSRIDQARPTDSGTDVRSAGRGGRQRSRARSGHQQGPTVSHPPADPLYAPMTTIRALGPSDIVKISPPQRQAVVHASHVAEPYLFTTLSAYGFPTLPPPDLPVARPAGTQPPRQTVPRSMRAAFVPYADGPSTPPAAAAASSTFAAMQRSVNGVRAPSISVKPPEIERRASIDSYGARSRQPSFSRRGSGQHGPAGKENGTAAEPGRGAAAASWRA